MKVSELLVRVGVAKNIKEGEKLILQKPVYVDDMRIKNINEEVEPMTGMEIKIRKMMAVVTKQCLKKEI